MKHSVISTLLVDDMQVAVDFYSSTIGLFFVESDTGTGVDRLVTLRLRELCECFVLLLCNATRDQELSALVGRQTGNATLLTLPVKDLSDVVFRLRRSNVEIVREYELPYAEYALIRDPFGNEIDLCETL